MPESATLQTTKEATFERIDALEQAMVALGSPVHMPVEHRFTQGLYSRQITMPAGTLLTSKIHKTQHQYVVSRGRARVLVAGGDWQEIAAPYHGITEPGTRRVLYIEEETVWTTFHPGNWKTVEQVEADIIEKRDEHLEGLTDAQRDALRLMQTGGDPCLG